MNKKMSATDASSTVGMSAGSSHPLTLDELTIIMRPSGLSMTQYIGTRLQLETEGVIPAGTAWPNGFDRTDWKADGLDFILKRERPEGAKGRRRDFLDCDNWCLRVHNPASDWSEDALELQARTLDKMLYARTPEGRAEFHRKFEAYCAAECDERFQAFKALIPSLVPPPRKRRMKAGADNQSNGACNG